MVDNENQWEDSEYNDSSDYNDSNENYEEDYSDSEYESYGEDNDDDVENEETYQQPKANFGGCIVFIILIALILSGVFFFVIPKFKSNKTASNQPVSSPQVAVEQTSETPNNQDVGEMFFNEAGGESTEMMSIDFNSQNNQESNVPVASSNESNQQETFQPIEISGETTPPSVEKTAPQVEQTENTSKQTENDLFSQSDLNVSKNQGSDEILVSYNKSARLNPFKPPVVNKDEEAYALINNTEFEIIEPPVDSVADENLTKLLQTQISGILFDEISPSAIVNLNGLDQFVKTGDVVSGYKIESITKDKVQISYKNNSYVASVGELFTKGSLEKQQAVVRLEEKFAGRYKNINRGE